MTDFNVQNADTNERQGIDEFETWTLERPDAEIFAKAFTQPPELGSQLSQAAKRYIERFLHP